MNYFLTTLLSYLLLYKYVALFLIIFSSAIIVPWPENTLLLAAGAFAGQGYFNIWGLFFVALGANVLGDIIDFVLTKTWGYAFIKQHHIKKYRSVDRINQYVNDHAGITILLTRFTGTIGPVVNFLSGLVGVSYQRFIIFDVIGNILDIGLFLVAGFILGTVWQNFSGITNIIGWMIMVVFALSIAVHLFRGRTPHNHTS